MLQAYLVLPMDQYRRLQEMYPEVHERCNRTLCRRLNTLLKYRSVFYFTHDSSLKYPIIKSFR